VSGEIVEIPTVMVCSRFPDKDIKGYLEQLGVRFRGINPDDDSYQFAELTNGLRKVNRSAVIWDLLDGKGRKRAGVVMDILRPTSRYELCDNVADFIQDRTVHVTVTDCEKVIFSQKEIKLKWWHFGNRIYNRQVDIAVHWLCEHYPNHADFTAYWDD
jgi:hypothetical protein